MATLYGIGESVQSLLQGGDPPVASKFQFSEIKIAVIQTINSLLKLQFLTEEMSGGESIPEGTMLAEYDNVAVEPYKGVSRATLPAMPIKLPLNMGVFHVSKTDDIINGFIPFEPGQLQMIGEEPLISDILGQIGYEPRGKYIVFNKNITEGDTDSAIHEVYMLLAVKDISLYGDFDMLPINASMELDVIQTTFKALSGQFPSNKKVDVIDKQGGKP